MESVLSKRKCLIDSKAPQRDLYIFVPVRLRGSKMTTKRCKAVVLSPMVNALIIDGNHQNVSQSTCEGAMDLKSVLAINKLVILIARHRAFVEDARSGRILDLQHGHDGRHHRHDVSRSRSVINRLQFVCSIFYFYFYFRKLSI